ncbi:cytoskeleton protein RodZ [Tamilnaduibacter salinus]|uniref:Cytoskeleton protein RodZ n=1 Tax=Tamilnaduibacter salinus TaxID=1484056 RepID=A0A2U1CZ64_9GAMM|nr:RodZ domain-containing protein [Tamilnaduibacter salinus]PVY78001.1 cytoskeleton protein RodZ [Tamilnaduibacter salinus]
MTDDEQEPMGAARDGDTGRRLREARETAGYSVTEVAEQQNLRPAIIETIEAGEYDQIDSELFLKGYVRSYAGLLGLDADAVIQVLDEELEPLREEAEQARRNDPLEEIERRKRQKQRIARWTAGLVLAVLAGWFLYWFAQSDLARSGGQMLEQTMQQEAAEEAEPSGEPADTPESGDAAAPGDGPMSGAPSGSEESDTAVQEDGLTDTGAVDDPMPAATQDTPEPVTEPPSTESDEGPPEREEPSSGSGVDAEPNADTSVTEPDTMASVSTGTPTSPTSHNIVIDFSGDCWVQIEDGGRTVVSGLQRADDEVRYTGTGPFRIVLGAVDVASVRFDGEAVDLSDIPAPSNRAVLTLGNDNA